MENRIFLDLRLVHSLKCDMCLVIKISDHSVAKNGVLSHLLSAICSSICPIIWENTVYFLMEIVHDFLMQSPPSIEVTGMDISMLSWTVNMHVMSALGGSGNGLPSSYEMSSKARQMDSLKKLSICTLSTPRSTVGISIVKWYKQINRTITLFSRQYIFCLIFTEAVLQFLVLYFFTLSLWKHQKHLPKTSISQGKKYQQKSSGTASNIRQKNDITDSELEESSRSVSDSYS